MARRLRLPQRRRRAAAAATLVVAVIVVVVVFGATVRGGSGHSPRSQKVAARGRPASHGGGRSTATTTTVPPSSSSSAAAPTTTISPLLPPPGAGDTGQTTAEPSTSTPTFQAEMAALWQAVQTGDAGTAMPVFFPESAYEEVKALNDDAYDWQNRLAAHFQLDIGAAHDLLGADAGADQLVNVVVPSTAAWIPPGACDNRLGYWHVPGARVIYDDNGVTRSFGIASLISWRGYWYVVHLGSVQPPAGQGVVDAPATGTGVFTPTGGC